MLPEAHRLMPLFDKDLLTIKKRITARGGLSPPTLLLLVITIERHRKNRQKCRGNDKEALSNKYVVNFIMIFKSVRI